MLLSEIVGPDLDVLKGHLANLFSSHGIPVVVNFTRHFYERLAGREVSVTPEAVYSAFSKAVSMYKQQIIDALTSSEQYEGVIKDYTSKLSIVFVVKKPVGTTVSNKYALYCVTLKQGNPSQFVTRSSGDVLTTEAVDDIVDVGSYVPLPKPGKKRKGKGKVTDPTTDRAMNSIINTQWFYQNSDAS